MGQIVIQRGVYGGPDPGSTGVLPRAQLVVQRGHPVAAVETFHLLLEDGSGAVLLEDGSYLLLESAP